MALTIARFINLLISSTMVGNEFGGWAAVHPALSTLPTTPHILAEQAVVRRYGQIMPVWMTAAIISCLPVLALTPNRRSMAFRATFAGMLCFIAMLGVTFRGNIPINQQILQLSADTPPPNWLELRVQWDRFHTLRNLLNVTGLCCLLVSALARDGAD